MQIDEFKFFSSLLAVFFREQPDTQRWPQTYCQLTKGAFFPPPPGRPAERQRPADCGERRVAAGSLQPRCHGGAEALHVVGGQLPGNHPAGGAARPPPGTMQEKTKLKNQKSKIKKCQVEFVTRRVLQHVVI